MKSPVRLALVLAAVQCFAAVAWTLYAAVLPPLLASAGLPPSARPWILLADVVVFGLCDLAAGAWLDRADGTLKRIGGAVLAAMSIATLAFVALPHVARGASMAPVLLAAIGVWVVASGALRAPLPRLLARYVSLHERPWLGAFLAVGSGLAGLLLPKTLDVLQRLGAMATLALSGATLWLLVVVLVVVERGAGAPAATVPASGVEAPEDCGWVVAATALTALGSQLVTMVAMPTLLRRFVTETEALDGPAVFGAGMALAVVPALAVRWVGSAWVLRVASVVGVAGALGVGLAGSLGALVAAIAASGLAWGLTLTASLTALTERAPSGRVSRWMGAWFAAQAAAGVARMVVGDVAPKVACLAALGLWSAAVVLWPPTRRAS